jgi:tRNA1(Val) A37 N6-methylase TrmN6
MEINRIWAMPNSLTFKIKPIKELVESYVNMTRTKVIIDPFANNSKYGTITNDLNPEFKTDFNLDALEFLKLQKTESADLVLYDPPYSITQASQMYKEYGKDKLELHVSNMKYWSNCKNEVARILKPNGICIICGWSSNGLGINRGFSMLEILLVPHGGSKNDTIVTVETKIVKKQLEMF